MRDFDLYQYNEHRVSHRDLCAHRGSVVVLRVHDCAALASAFVAFLLLRLIGSDQVAIRMGW